jgi:hypothetical protein
MLLHQTIIKGCLIKMEYWHQEILSHLLVSWSVWQADTTAVCIHMNVNCLCASWIVNKSKCYWLSALWMDLCETGTNYVWCIDTYSWMFQGLTLTTETYAEYLYWISAL